MKQVIAGFRRGLYYLLLPAFFFDSLSHAELEEQQLSNAQVLAWMRELKPLPKVHYSWPLPFRKLSDEFLFAYVRLSRAASLSGEWGTTEQMHRAVLICQQVNDTKPKIPATIAINFSVWHRRFGKDLPPTDTGATHKQELDYLAQRMETMRDELARANKKHQSAVKVSAILFDSERFHTKKGDEEWNQALTDKYNAAYEIVREIFPKVGVEWYARGAVHPGASPTGWSEATYFTLNEKGQSFGCSLYQGPEIGYTRAIFRKTAENAAKHGCDEVTPWIALAFGYRRQTTSYHEWGHDWNYDLIYSWKLGIEINNRWYGVLERKDRFAPWDKARIAIFYPEPFGRAPHWGRHFVAYVRGANGGKTLPGEE